MKSAAGSETSRITLSGELRLLRDELGVEEPKAATGERRIKPRLSQPFPTRAWGTDVANQAFEIDCLLDNISSTGLYLRIPGQMKLGDELSVVIKFLNDHNTGATAVMRGQILRDEPQPDGRHGVAVAIRDHYFL
jgi:hypothetical protein